MRVLFVCTGNICRSPLAERYASHWAEQHGTAIEATSVGTHALVGYPMDPDAAEALAALGGTSDGFAARALTTTDARNADLILVMERAHRDRVLATAPAATLRTFTLSEAALIASQVSVRTIRELAIARTRVPQAVDAPDILDPFRQGPATHRRIAEEIAAKVDIVLGMLAPSTTDSPKTPTL
ncbi:arsenate reductase/protein-tyrosine-phosphatase family protein [Lolliginicoccus suaedae]|uniref:arsenate reductase/protein-tyrosine-phosphatase family protein n=1 Tax=Lolliginicoccus suaedae TaxID=2605429 RepID=UPI0011EBC881|nr:low molecular weight phosphatase family protein [Lolliginicoccus suaedae]